MRGRKSTSLPDEELERCLEIAFAEHRQFRALVSQFDGAVSRWDRRKSQLAAAGAKVIPSHPMTAAFRTEHRDQN
jgi:hypothetical protein